MALSPKALLIELGLAWHKLVIIYMALTYQEDRAMLESNLSA